MSDEVREAKAVNENPARNWQQLLTKIKKNRSRNQLQK